MLSASIDQPAAEVWSVQDNSECPCCHAQRRSFSYLLPEDFVVYGRILPTYNDYMGADGGYVAIYTHNASQGVYSVGGGIYVVGQIRVQGHYDGRIFIPKGYKRGDNITQDPEILAIGAKYRDMKGCWIGGDTGGWFGIPG